MPRSTRTETQSEQPGVGDPTPALFAVEVVPLEQLKPHPQNYNSHPADEIEHLKASITENGVYRNVVVAKDYTLLAGHGVTLALRELGRTEVPVHRLDLDPMDPRAIKVLVADNEVSHLASKDDRLLASLLKRVMDEVPTGLAGTGYDAMMLANLLMVTRPASEVADLNEAAAWVGMPEFVSPNEPIKCIVAFENEADRDDFARRLGLKPDQIKKSMWWPYREREDLLSVRVISHQHTEQEKQERAERIIAAVSEQDADGKETDDQKAEASGGDGVLVPSGEGASGENG
jgi:hypothetical protein